MHRLKPTAFAGNGVPEPVLRLRIAPAQLPEKQQLPPAFGNGIAT
jgi:hypothetical protein